MANCVENLDCAANDLEDFGFEQQYLAPISVPSWLKRKPQHFDGGGDLDVLVADDEI